MKKLFLFSATLLFAYTGFSQDIPGLIAHWDMNGTTNDVSGDNINGTGNNITPSYGEDGVMGHAYYFDGTSSTVTFPYNSLLNVSGYSITAVVKPQGFYTGTCHGNIIFNRGTTGPNASGAYFLAFNDYTAGYGCTEAMDTTAESFYSLALADGYQLMPNSILDFDATPHIQTNQWYNIVATFNDTSYKVYVNGELVSTAYLPNPGTPIGSSTDSGSIGYCVYDAEQGYPYYFKGDIDDIRFYDHALNSLDVSKLYHTTAVNNVSTQDQISVSPNPAKNTIHINSPIAIMQADIINMLGQTVDKQTTSNKSLKMDIGDLAPGIYILKVNNQFTKQIIKQ